MNFSEVTDITIPEGSVERITDSSNRVLWEKGVKLSPSWLITSSEPANTSNGLGLPVVAITPFANPSSSSSQVVYNVSTVTRSNGGDEYVVTSPVISLNSSKDTLIVKGYSTGSVGYTLYGIAKPRHDSYAGIAIHFDKNYEKYYLRKDYYSQTSVIQLTTEPISATSVCITHAVERSEFLISGLKAGLCVMPTGFSSGYTMTYQSGRNFSKTSWASGIGTSGLYFGVTGTNGSVSYSVDGTTWMTSTALSSGNVLGVVYLSKKNKVCAISSNTKKLAISSDGVNWETKDAPTSQTTAYCYSPDYDVLCLFDTTGAYITKNLSSWEYLPFSDNARATLHDVIYYGYGTFIGYEYLVNKLYFLSLTYPIRRN